ncbi:homocitrate synthase/isopropylmalate synthase family protein [Staphylococcus saprophyticus]
MEEDGVVKNGESYEIRRPELVGVKTRELGVGKVCGKEGFGEKLSAVG